MWERKNGGSEVEKNTTSSTDDNGNIFYDARESDVSENFVSAIGFDPSALLSELKLTQSADNEGDNDNINVGEIDTAEASSGLRFQSSPSPYLNFKSKKSSVEIVHEHDDGTSASAANETNIHTPTTSLDSPDGQRTPPPSSATPTKIPPPLDIPNSPRSPELVGRRSMLDLVERSSRPNFAVGTSPSTPPRLKQPSPPPPSEDCFRVIDNDTGLSYDIRSFKESQYSLIPSRETLLRQFDSRCHASDDDGSLSTITAESKASDDETVDKTMAITTISESDTPKKRTLPRFFHKKHKKGETTTTTATTTPPPTTTAITRTMMTRTTMAKTATTTASAAAAAVIKKTPTVNLTSPLTIAKRRRALAEPNAKDTTSTKDDETTKDKNNSETTTQSTTTKGAGRMHFSMATPLMKTKLHGRVGGSNFDVPRNTIPMKGGEKGDSMLLLSSLTRVHDGPIWTMTFSRDGTYFATGGEDSKVLVWEVAVGRGDAEWEVPLSQSKFGGGSSQKDISVSDDEGKEEDNEEEEEDDELAHLPGMVGTLPALGQEIQVLPPKPIQSYTFHTASVIDLSFSTNSFLLTASLDRTVHLYHPSRPNTLHIFHHSDMVTAVAFHPFNSHLFVSGCFDNKLRLWNIVDSRVQEWTRCPDIITSTRFTPSGKFVVAGTMKGKIHFYEKGMRYYTQFDAKNKKDKDGKKITGLDFIMGVEGEDEQSLNWCTSWETCESGSLPGGANMGMEDKLGVESAGGSKRQVLTEQMLVTSNDSRLRLYGLDDFNILKKYKGLVNDSMQIKAHFSESCNNIICGGESGQVSIWSTSQNISSSSPSQKKTEKIKSRRSFEATKASPPIVTDAVFVPNVCAKRAVEKSGLFPAIMNMNSLDCDFSSGFVVTSDYDGTVRIFMDRGVLNEVVKASGPEGMMEE